MPSSEGNSNNFTLAKDLYFDKIKLPSRPDNGKADDSKYARASRLGICFKCFREDENPAHRPKHRVFAFCDECQAELAIGIDKIEMQGRLEINKWFKDLQ